MLGLKSISSAAMFCAVTRWCTTSVVASTESLRPRRRGCYSPGPRSDPPKLSDQLGHHDRTLHSTVLGTSGLRNSTRMQETPTNVPVAGGAALLRRSVSRCCSRRRQVSRPVCPPSRLCVSEGKGFAKPCGQVADGGVFWPRSYPTRRVGLAKHGQCGAGGRIVQFEGGN